MRLQKMLLATKKKTYDARCDLFALGVILFVLLGAITLSTPWATRRTPY